MALRPSTEPLLNDAFVAGATPDSDGAVLLPMNIELNSAQARFKPDFVWGESGQSDSNENDGFALLAPILLIVSAGFSRAERPGLSAVHG
jgi:hypothetical protein